MATQQLKRRISEEPDAGNLHVRFCEGAGGGRRKAVATSSTRPQYATSLRAGALSDHRQFGLEHLGGDEAARDAKSEVRIVNAELPRSGQVV